MLHKAGLIAGAFNLGEGSNITSPAVSMDFEELHGARPSMWKELQNATKTGYDTPAPPGGLQLRCDRHMLTLKQKNKLLKELACEAATVGIGIVRISLQDSACADIGFSPFD